jgi:hypothetical protein
MKLFVIFGVLVLALVLAACGDEPPRVREANLTTTDTEFQLSGTGKSISPPFRVKLKGQYRAYWKASKQSDGANDPSGCPMSAEMESATQGIGYHRTLTGDSTESAEKAGAMETRPFSLEALSYSVSVDTSCEWTITLERQLQP